MGLHALGHIMAHSTASGGDRLALICIADQAGTWESPWEVWPSLPLLARHCGTSERTVRTTIERLVKQGHLVPHSRGGGFDISTAIEAPPAP